MDFSFHSTGCVKQAEECWNQTTRSTGRRTARQGPKKNPPGVNRRGERLLGQPYRRVDMAAAASLIRVSAAAKLRKRRINPCFRLGTRFSR